MADEIIIELEEPKIEGSIELETQAIEADIKEVVPFNKVVIQEGPGNPDPTIGK